MLVDPSDRRPSGGVIGSVTRAAEIARCPTTTWCAQFDDVSFETARLPVPYGTAWRMMQTIGKIQSGERVLILSFRRGRHLLRAVG